MYASSVGTAPADITPTSRKVSPTITANACRLIPTYPSVFSTMHDMGTQDAAAGPLPTESSHERASAGAQRGPSNGQQAEQGEAPGGPDAREPVLRPSAGLSQGQRHQAGRRWPHRERDQLHQPEHLDGPGHGLAERWEHRPETRRRS